MEFLNLFTEQTCGVVNDVQVTSTVRVKAPPIGADSRDIVGRDIVGRDIVGRDIVGRDIVAQGDAIDWLDGLSPNSVDLVITDPPYESLEKHRAIGTTTRLKHSKSSSNDWFKIFPNERFPALFKALYRVLKNNAHLYLFCDQTTLFVIKPMAEAAGFTFWKPLVWDKKTIGMGYHYRARYEFILFFEKGKRKLNNLGIADVIECPRIVRGYPTEKPVMVSRTLIEQSSDIGDIVIDPFAGSGSVGVAALESERYFIGNDIAEEAVQLARKRLSEVMRTKSNSVG